MNYNILLILFAVFIALASGKSKGTSSSTASYVYATMLVQYTQDNTDPIPILTMEAPDPTSIDENSAGEEQSTTLSSVPTDEDPSVLSPNHYKTVAAPMKGGREVDQQNIDEFIFTTKIPKRQKQASSKAMEKLRGLSMEAKILIFLAGLALFTF